MYKLNPDRLKGLKDTVSVISNLSQKLLEKYSSLRAALLLLIFLYVGFVNAYNLFFVPPDGRPIMITDTEIYKPQQRFFEKVDVIETKTQGPIESPTKETIPKEQTSTKYNPLQEPISPVKENQEYNEIVSIQQSPTSQLTAPLQQTQAPNIAKESMPSTPEKSTQQIVSSVSISDVQQLSERFQLFDLKDGSILELHISESYGEAFTIYIQGGVINVMAGESSNEDLELWTSRSAFEELLKTSDVASATKRLEGERKVSAKQKASDWALYRKGYKSLAERMGLR